MEQKLVKIFMLILAISLVTFFCFAHLLCNLNSGHNESVSEAIVEDSQPQYQVFDIESVVDLSKLIIGTYEQNHASGYESPLGSIDDSAASDDSFSVSQNDPKYFIEADDKDFEISLEQPLMNAIINKNFAMVESLLKQGANARGPSEKGFETNPLMLAIQTHDIDMVSLVLDYGADHLACNKHGISAVQAAAIHGYIRGIDFFIKLEELKGNLNAKNVQVPWPEEGEEVTEERFTGATLMHFAVTANQLNLVRHLIHRQKVDLTLQDENGFTAFDHALYCLKTYAEMAQNDPDQFEEKRRNAETIFGMLCSGVQQLSMS
jgi:ankyrin repeat protein